VRPHLHPETLRTSRAIHDEAMAATRIYNQFFFVNAPRDVLDKWMIYYELPLLQFDTGGEFKGVVLVHTVTETAKRKDEKSGKMFHLRDFGKFMEVLKIFA
jgi:hypothetical protein